MAHPMARRGVRLGVAWETRGEAFRSSLSALLHGPAPPRGWPVGPFFRTTWLRIRPPWKMLTLSGLWHVLAVVLPFWLWATVRSPAPPVSQRYELAWSGPIRDLLPYLPPRPRAKPRMPGARSKQAPPKGTDAFHPRQIIVSAPLKITHPRQTLIQPDAPPAAPKFLPALPNIALWTPAPPPPARRHLRVDTSARIRAHMRTAKPMEPEPTPDAQKNPALAPDIALASAAPNIARPKLEVRRTSAPRFRARSATPESSAPEPDAATAMPIDTAAQRLVALSANPAPPPPKLEVPEGNLSARFAISPEGKQAGVPGGAAAAASAGEASAGGGGRSTGIPGVSISGGNPANAAAISGLGNGTGSGSGITPMVRASSSMLPLAPVPRADAASVARARTDSLLDRIKPGAPPENILEPGRIYTLHVNVPNLSSVTGSWVLKFTELAEEERSEAGLGSPADLSGPVPLRKVDPKYPPALVSAKIQGEVVLYAIIRRDGTVDSIQLIQGLDPQLDQNAMEALARWKFRAAEKQGKPIELETIVRIPFRIASSIY
jgi:TonB family protein